MGLSHFSGFMVYVDVIFISHLIYIGMHIDRDYMIVGSVNFCVHAGMVGTVSWFISVSWFDTVS